MLGSIFTYCVYISVSRSDENLVVLVQCYNCRHRNIIVYSYSEVSGEKEECSRLFEEFERPCLAHEAKVVSPEKLFPL